MTGLPIILLISFLALLAVAGAVIFFRVQRQLSAVGKSLKALPSMMQETRTRMEAVSETLIGIPSERQQLRSQIEGACEKLSTVSPELHDLRSQLASAHATLAKLGKEIELAQTDALRLRESLSFLFDKVFTSLPRPDAHPKEDIRVVLGIRDREEYRLRNALASLRNQTYPSDLLQITVIDYGSRPDAVGALRECCEKFSAQYIRVDKTENWNRAHCLNIGIKSADTKYILTSDVDIVFDREYIAKAIEELRRNPYQIIHGEMLDSLEGQITPTTDLVKDYSRIKAGCIRRSERKNSPGYTFGMSIIAGVTRFFKEVCGHDEHYAIWGFEDDDIVLRLRMIGLRLKKLSDNVSYIHQWHPESVADGEKKYVEKNKEYFRRSYSIQRNPAGWGEPPPAER